MTNKQGKETYFGVPLSEVKKATRALDKRNKQGKKVGKRELIGYNCKKCRGKAFFEEGNVIVHVCEGFAEPVYSSPQQKGKK